MQNNERVISLPLKSLLFAGGGLAIFMTGVASLYFGISDGSLVFIIPFLLGPSISILGIAYGIKSVRNNISPKALAIAGIMTGCVSLLTIIVITVFILMLVSGLEGIY
jgi:hypothetical protein